MRTTWPACRPRLWLATLIGVLFFVSPAARAEYRLDSGDIIEVSVFGVQDFKRRAAVNVDGEISLPLLGDFRAAGLTLAELRSQLKEALVTNNIIRGPDVTADLVEHRPFYINGDVAKAGAHPYQPALTVRHAVAIAGGYDVMRFKVDNPLIAAAELRSQYESLWTEYVRREGRVTSLNAELEDKATLDLSKLHEAPIARRVISELVKLELDSFNMRKTDHRKEKDYLQRALKHAQDQVSSLFQGHEQEKLSIDIQAESLARTSALSSKGLAPITRLAEDQRAVALQKSRTLETGARLSEAYRIMEEYGRRVQRADDDRSLKLLRELQDAVVELEKARTQLQGIGEKLLYVGAIKSQLARGGSSAPDIRIYRKVDGKQTRIDGDENSEVAPGDVVDVVFSQKQLMLTGAR